MRVDTAVEKFCKGYFATSLRSHHTRRAYEGDLAQFQEFVTSEALLGEIDASKIEEWSNELREHGYAPSSCKRKLATLRVFFHYWVRLGVLVGSPMAKLRFHFGPTRKLPKTLNKSEMRALLKAAEDRTNQSKPGTTARVDRAFIAFRNLTLLRLLFATGIRVGEAVALDVKDFCTSENSFRVFGKGGRSRMAFLAAEQAIECQHQYLQMRAGVETECSALFLNSAGRRISTQGVAYSLRVIAATASIGKKLTPHMLRHTAATFLLRNGADIRIVQEFLGHASIVTTQRYTHVTKDDLVSALRDLHPDITLRHTEVHP